MAPLRLSVLLVALAAVRCRAQGKKNACVESLDSVFVAERDVKDDFVLRSYVLCPNTTFTVASAFNESGGPVEGQYPLKIGRSNIHVLCGEDGSSANDCVLEGGMEQLVFADLFKTNHSVTNVLVQGLTFSKAKTSNAVVQNKGHLSLVDCIFRVRFSLVLQSLYLCRPRTLTASLSPNRTTTTRN
jgi:hypothetical protein